MEKLKESFFEVLTAILPMTIIILLLGLTVARFDTAMFISFFAGAIMIIAGMTLFLFGANYSMMEVGRTIGTFLMMKGKLWIVIVFGFLIGCVVTIAEPDVKVLAINVFEVSEGNVPEILLMIVVGIGVGVFIAIALLRIIFQKNLVVILLIGYIVAFLVAFFFTHDNFVPVAFDSGGVTTGPLTVPFILAFASGVTSVMPAKKDGDDSFGMVGLASLGPIISILILGGFHS